MTSVEHVVSPEVLEKREFPFTEYQLNQIRVAKQLGRDLRGTFVNSDGRTFIWELDIVWGSK